ncbi:hypothetical protein CMsap09_11880 [Clavibacter michiganensis]|uniref:Uncharacterized protein n=1 Tax=Clavibacter michiganensis TaxID=28447 RepID=A0A251XVV5_9MICO|nr:hypothetical protein CMsap09_11880 [Clavibacter michiganensis]
MIQGFKVLRSCCYLEEEVLGPFIISRNVAKLSAIGD